MSEEQTARIWDATDMLIAAVAHVTAMETGGRVTDEYWRSAYEALGEALDEHHNARQAAGV